VAMSWVRLNGVEALGWALLHFLWEGALIALAVWAVLAGCRSARLRYGVAFAGTLAMFAAFAVTVWVSIPENGFGAQSAWSLVEGRAMNVAASDGDGLSGMVRSGLGRLLPWVVAVWMVGAFGIGLYRIAGWSAVLRIRREGVCAAPIEWHQRMVRLARRVGVSKPVALLESSLAEVPLVIGMLRPAILIPAGLLTGMPVSQMEAILLHELAHIRRLDYVVNLIESVAESLLFYHPAVWWISGVMRAERENCCDDVVVAAQGDARGYAAALLVLEERRVVGRELVPAATGGNLMNRLQRILDRPEARGSAVGPVVLTALLLGLVCVLAVGQQRVANPEPADVAAEESAFTRWLEEDVAYIIDPVERNAFDRLRTDEEREHFIEQFWQRRDPTPNTIDNEFKEEHYRRIAYANSRWGTEDTPGWTTDLGRAYILYGPPDERTQAPGWETWRYPYLEGYGSDVLMTFTDSENSGHLKLTEVTASRKPSDW